MRQTYGFPELVSKYWRNDVDFYVLSNEDIGFVDAMVATTNDIYNFALPYPATVNLSEETIVVYALEFVYQAPSLSGSVTSYEAIAAFLSFLDKDFAVDWRGAGSDIEDEALKSKFARNIIFGRTKSSVTAVVSVEGAHRDLDNLQQAIYFPPVPLDLVYPLFVDFVNNTMTITLADNTGAIGNFSGVERVNIVVWFTKRKLTASEKSARSVSQRFAQLDA